MDAIGDAIYVVHDETVSIILPNDATGTVTVTIDGKTYSTKVVDGKAVFVIPDLPAGVYKATVRYSGDAKYNSTVAVTKIIVNGNNDTRNDTHAHGHAVKHSKNTGDGIDLSTHATGNPLWILLLVILTIGSTQIRRFKK